ncbi:MAG TPA: hydroxymethylbilane synthase [Pyrinomonadaceae bacterium]|nr:hydroxymethylbilane synthase [Pyrinomonadaceae bacterium]
MKQVLVIGSRGSKLALKQARFVQSELERISPSLETRIEIITTSGDVKTDPLSVIGGKGVFTKELEDALFDRRIDLAVHSLKDLPTILPDGLTIAGICKREDPRDALVLGPRLASAGNASIHSLPQKAIVGTSSPRRLAQLIHLRNDLVFQDLRGNVDTRLRKLDEGQYDALVLACAGLRRLGLEHRISAALASEQMLPSPGQGALAIETRAEDQDTIEAVKDLDHKFTRLACTAERAFLRSLGGGCQLPIAAYAAVRDKNIRLDGLVADPQGMQILRDRISGSIDKAEQLGNVLAERLLTNGARKLLDTSE